MKIKTEQFIEKAKQKHGDRYDYSKVEYINSTTEVLITCKIHGDFLQTPKIHYRCNCPKCGRNSQINKATKGKEIFIQQAKELYGDKYSYDLVEYKNNKTPVKIICKKLGIFEVKPDAFLTKGKQNNGIFKKLRKSKDKELFLKEVFKIYGNKYDYTNTIVGNSKGKIDIICKDHGKFTVYIMNHFSGQGCPKCSMINYNKLRVKSKEKFVEQAIKVHGDKCDYTDTIYTSSKNKVTIKCNKHNEYFEMLPINHLKGGRCKKCLSENISEALKGIEGTCGYTKNGYIKQAKGREAYVYVIRCYDNNEEFYKIGKTFLDINSRFTKSNLCYNFEKIHFYFGEAGFIYDLEKKLHKRYKKYKYKPNNWFAGHTECFSLDLPINEIIEL